MAQQAIDSLGADRPFGRSPRPEPRALPSLGMRGGLGRTLLIAFLLLAIVPLSLLALLTYNQIQRDTRQKLVTSLETMVALKEAHLADWVASYERELSLLAGALDQNTDHAAQLVAIQAADPTLSALLLVDLDSGEVVASTDLEGLDPRPLQTLVEADQGLVIGSASLLREQPLAAVSHTWDGRMLIGLLSWDSLQQIIAGPQSGWEGAMTRLVTDDGWMLSADGLVSLSPEEKEAASEAVAEALQGQRGAGAYTDLEGEPVFGAYLWNPELQVGLLAEQSQRQVLAAGNNLAALVAGATLAVALITAAIAAVVTRRITRPIVQLTERAAWMARGDLNQEVAIERRDEIGVLARAFNRMAAELRSLYDDLEAKVAERTGQLEEANEQTQYYLMQLATSAEVARVATSLRDLHDLLSTVVELLGRAFELHHTSIYLLDENGESAVWQVGSRGSDLLPKRLEVGGATLIGLVAADGRRRVVRADAGGDGLVQPRCPVECELAVPLRVQERMLGVLDLQSTCAADFDENEQVVYQSLADQISIAIENARAYALERETVERLRELDRIQSQFLTNMSHALRTPLNSVIGFSRLVLKELDGPLNEVQREDITTVYESGRQLLGLIDDMLELSHLQLGVAPFAPEEVHLGEIIDGVMATTQALARGKPVRLYTEVPADLPAIYTDGQRVRQVILALLSNAVKFTDEGSIRLRVAPDDGQVTISIQDTGRGIPREEQARLFAETLNGEAASSQEVSGFGLAISKRVVERLGGQIWVESERGVGSTFTFTLPVRTE